ncbi:helix-turn-helix domain-containing protein [Flavivirga jejuensis]|uniref:Helix-turn-helix transcriptional regulator n=1 Tax=Flavivirga jejuensis TaxID=870487 RepID=A0ABT8WQY7_9FLAO|nr:helix-turn-helix transcriptional regulator [Flavivirga jejuensis]MDO5975602.1 helix-turn-helix transcriptional regulator [Flavivirga jejuensis]
MIKPNQIKAARAMCGWSRSDLSEHSGIHDATIKAIENGEVDNPRSNTLDPIIEAFGRKGVEFIDGGVREKKDKIRILEGKDKYLRLMDEIYRVLKDSSNKEVLVSHADQRRSTEPVIEAQKRMMKAGIRIKFTVCEGDKYLLYPLENYRYIPKKDFLNSAIIVYGDYVSISVGENTTKITIIHDETIAEVFRRQFKTLWNIYKEPTEALLEK